MSEFLIIGGGAQGRLITEIVNSATNYDTVNAEMHTDIADDIKDGIIAIGDIAVRKKVVDYVLQLIPDFRFRYLYHPTAIIGENVKIGKGTMIMAGAIVNNGAVIGEHCLINSGVIVEHDNKIGNFVNLQPGVVTGGYVEVGDYSYIGIGAMIRDRVKIGSNTIVGMGAVVVKDIGENKKAWGNPARIYENNFTKAVE